MRLQFTQVHIIAVGGITTCAPREFNLQRHTITVGRAETSLSAEGFSSLCV